jgi:hypothetical protein
LAFFSRNASELSNWASCTEDCSHAAYHKAIEDRIGQNYGIAEPSFDLIDYFATNYVRMLWYLEPTTQGASKMLQQTSQQR